MRHRVVELAGLREFAIRAGDTATPGPGEVQVQVKYVGICGSDIHYFAEGGVGPAKCRYPMVIGHEPTGVIAALGAGVSGWSVGDPVLCEPAIYCYHCEFCLSGRHNVCSHIRFLSTPAEPGFFRDRVNLPAGNLIAQPKGVGLAEATLFEPMAIILHSMKFAQPAIGDTALVYGAGPIGLLTIAVLKLSGVSRIWCAEPVEHRRDMARAMGADAVFDPAATDVPKQIRADTANRGVDIAIDCATQGETINQCLRAARSAGRVVVTGIPSTLDYCLDIHALRVKELYFYTVRRSNHETHAGVHLLEEHPKLLGGIVTHTRPIETVNDTFRMVEHYEDGVGKAVLAF
jgi:L-iditol 2-dehydrogenase